jgi:mono/diheme cytochrome c family protein
MKNVRAVALLALACAAVIALPFGARASAGAPRLYSAAQAAAGKKLYAANCASCHGADLSGVSAPPLRGAAAPFHGSQSVAEVYAYISGQMPLNNPGGLPPATYASILAYIMQQNGLPAGTASLTPAVAKVSPATI